jgi:hypothetical protein
MPRYQPQQLHSTCLLRQAAELHGHQLKGHVLPLLRIAARDARRLWARHQWDSSTIRTSKVQVQMVRTIAELEPPELLDMLRKVEKRGPSNAGQLDPSQFMRRDFIIIIFERNYDQLQRTLNQISIEPFARFIRLASGARHKISNRHTKR